MEIAKGTVRRNPHNSDVKYNLTPAEVMLLHAIHFKNAQGSPLGDDFAVYGEAVTIEYPSKPAEDETFNGITGHRTPGTPAVPAKTHKRTNSEEVARLKKKFANVRVLLDSGADVEAFGSVFGTAIMPKLPQTFDEIEDVVGIKFPQLSAAPVVDSEATAYRNTLLAKPRHAIVQLALDAKIHVCVTDDNASIVDKIIAAENAESGGEPVVVINSAKAKFVNEASGFTVAELKDQASKHGVVLEGGEKKSDIIEALWAKIGINPTAE